MGAIKYGGPSHISMVHLVLWLFMVCLFSFFSFCVFFYFFYFFYNKAVIGFFFPNFPCYIFLYLVSNLFFSILCLNTDLCHDSNSFGNFFFFLRCLKSRRKHLALLNRGLLKKKWMTHLTIKTCHYNNTSYYTESTFRKINTRGSLRNTFGALQESLYKAPLSHSYCAV